MFIITGNYALAKQAEEDYQQFMPNGGELITLQQDHFLVLGKGYHVPCSAALSGGTAWVIGTLFDIEGRFNAEAILCYKDINSLQNALKENAMTHVLFGHYIVICDCEDGTVVYTDPIGCLNVYYYNGDNEYIVGNDLLEIGALSGVSRLNDNVVLEFLARQSNTGSGTLFDSIKRMRIGCALSVSGNNADETLVSTYSIRPMTREAFSDRIRNYFQAVNKYPGRIQADLSAGHDTRFVTACAKAYIDHFTFFTAGNESDDGVDNEISKCIAEKLNIPIEKFDHSPLEKDQEMFWHASATLRDIHRSSEWPAMFAARYNQADLALGGYGGEIVRAKYADQHDLHHFIRDYYKGKIIEKDYGIKGYIPYEQSVLEQYIIPQGMNPDLLYNWYYTAAKMRIWGSAFLQMSTLYGDVLHPFMDWYMIEAVLGFDLKELQGSKLMNSIISEFAPEISGMPINQHLNAEEDKSIMQQIKESVKNGCLRGLYSAYKINQYRRSTKQIERVPSINTKLDVNHLLNGVNKTIRARMVSVLDICDYIAQKQRK